MEEKKNNISHSRQLCIATCQNSVAPIIINKAVSHQKSIVHFCTVLLHCNRSDLVLSLISTACERQTDRNSPALNGGTWTFWQTTIRAGTQTQTHSHFLSNSVRQLWQSPEMFTYFITEKEPQQGVRAWLVNMAQLTPCCNYNFHMIFTTQVTGSHEQRFKYQTLQPKQTAIKMNGNSSGLLPPQTQTDPPYCDISIFPSSFSASL